MDKRTAIAAGAIATSAGVATVEAIRRRAARSQDAALPGIRAQGPTRRVRAAYSPGPRANPETETAVVHRGEEAWARVLGH